MTAATRIDTKAEKSCDTCAHAIPQKERYKTALADGLCGAHSNERCLFVRFDQGGDCKDYLSRYPQQSLPTKNQPLIPVEIYL